MKFCTKLINELITNKKCQHFNWPFLEPVDAEIMKLYDYYEIIKEPMDLSTVKKKMEFKQYANADEVRSDIILMCNNCFLYNPADQPVHKLGKQLLVYKFTFYICLLLLFRNISIIDGNICHRKLPLSRNLFPHHQLCLQRKIRKKPHQTKFSNRQFHHLYLHILQNLLTMTIKSTYYFIM